MKFEELNGELLFTIFYGKVFKKIAMPDEKKQQ